MYAVLALFIGGGGVALCLLLGEINQLAWLSGLIGKLAFGGVLAAIVTPIGLRAMLSEPFRQDRPVLRSERL
jgi:hypothetical protein